MNLTKENKKKKKTSPTKSLTSHFAKLTVEKYPSKKPLLHVTVTAATAIGQRDYQEDRFLTTQLTPELFVACVADGHGGFQCAEFCIQKLKHILLANLERKQGVPNFRLETYLETVIGQLSQQWDTHVFDDPLIALRLAKSALERDKYYQDSTKFKEDAHIAAGKDSGTTFVIALADLRRRKLVMANIGDSRAVVIPRGTTAAIATQDHVVPLQMHIENFAVTIANGRMESDLAMARSLGDHGPTLTGIISRKPDLTTVAIPKGADLVMGSDGLWDVYSNAEVFVNGETAPELLARRKTEFQDNVTALVIHIAEK